MKLYIPNSNDGAPPTIFHSSDYSWNCRSFIWLDFDILVGKYLRKTKMNPLEILIEIYKLFFRKSEKVPSGWLQIIWLN
jgi:hypothetical protein